MNRQEEKLQESVIQFCMFKLPADVVYFHVPNGESRSPRTGAKLKRMGVRPGVADLCFLHNSRAYFIELKAAGYRVDGRTKGKKYPSPDQRIFRDDASAAGAGWACCWTLEEVIDSLWGWGIIERKAAIVKNTG